MIKSAANQWNGSISDAGDIQSAAAQVACRPSVWRGRQWGHCGGGRQLDSSLPLSCFLSGQIPMEQVRRDVTQRSSWVHVRVHVQLARWCARHVCRCLACMCWGATMWWWGVSLPVRMEASAEMCSPRRAFRWNIFEVCVWVWACGLGLKQFFLFFIFFSIFRGCLGFQRFPTFLRFF